jgi:hypothetical protein
MLCNACSMTVFAQLMCGNSEMVAFFDDLLLEPAVAC